MMHLVTFTALSEFPDRLHAHFSALPETAQRPDGEDGNTHEAFDLLVTVHHREVTRYQPAISRAVLEDCPKLSEADLAGAEVEMPAGDTTGEALLAAFAAARKRTLSLLGDLTPEQWLREIVVGEDGRISLVSLAHLLCRDDFQRLATLQDLHAQLHSQ